MAVASAVASSGNIGPGFDVVALALDVRCEVKAEIADSWSCEQVGPHTLQVGEDLVLRAARETVGADRPLRLTVDNRIPLTRGLGSSAAAFAAGSAAALRAVGSAVDPQEVFERVSAFEGHADNAAATVFGGLVGILPNGQPRQLPLALWWRVIGAVPRYELRTSDARDILTSAVDRTLVIRSMGRLIALLEGLRTGNEDVLAQAGGDELHEGPRAGLHPLAADLMAAAREAGAAHACWSGAGPTVLAITSEDRVRPVEDALRVSLGDLGEVWTLRVASAGLI
jgi:homoserine kinase